MNDNEKRAEHIKEILNRLMKDTFHMDTFIIEGNRVLIQLPKTLNQN